MSLRNEVDKINDYVGRTPLVNSGESFDFRPDSLSDLVQNNRFDINELNHKIKMLEEFLGVELVKNCEKYQKKGKK